MCACSVVNDFSIEGSLHIWVNPTYQGVLNREVLACRTTHTDLEVSLIARFYFTGYLIPTPKCPL